MILSPLNDPPGASLTIRLVTISGNAFNAQPNTLSARDERPSNPHLTSTAPSTHETSHLAKPSASTQNSTLQDAAEAETAIASDSLAQVNPQLAHRMDQLEGNGVSVVAGAAKGLGSALSNLNGIVQIADLLAEVSETLSPVLAV